jgi:hypothetical protein
MAQFDYSTDDPVTHPIGSLPRAMGLLAWRERFTDPRLFPKGTSEEAIESYVLWAYVLHVRGFWKRRARSIRPSFGFRMLVHLHTLKRILLALAGLSQEDDQ